MLKKASNMAAIAQEVRAAALESQRAEQERAAEDAKQQAALDASHRRFELEATVVAREGGLLTVVSGHWLNQSRLRSQGFVVEQLTRRTSFEEHLSGLVAQKRKDLVQLADQVVSACPGIERVDGEAMLHRNPLISLLETLWRRDQLEEPFNVEQLLAFVRIQSAAGHADVEANKNLFQRVLERFSDLKATEHKHRRVCWENITIPKGLDKATYVSWESAGDGSGHVTAFSAQKLKWLATQWPKLAEMVGKRIEAAASEGETQLDVFVWRTQGDWYLSWYLPPEGDDLDDDEPQGGEHHPSHYWEGEWFCAPALVAEELPLLGYSVSMQPQPLQVMNVNKASDSSPKKPNSAAFAGEAHRLTIQWK